MPRKRRKPRCIVIAGPNGAGKTTFARDYLPAIAVGAPCRAHEKMAESARTPPFLLEHYYLRTKAVRQQLHRSVHPLDLGRARGTSLRASLNGLSVSTTYGLTKNLATNQRATRRDRTNVCMCQLDHLLQLP
jgi:hypothetical protein